MFTIAIVGSTTMERENFANLNGVCSRFGPTSMVYTAASLAYTAVTRGETTVTLTTDTLHAVVVYKP